MIFAFGDDRMIEVFENDTDARRSCEPFDVESRSVVFYAEDGAWLEPRFTRPNRRRFFGWVVEPGEYALIRRSAVEGGVETFEAAVANTVGVAPNPYFRNVEEIRKHVAGTRT